MAAGLALLVAAGVSACGGSYPDCLGTVRYGDHAYREIGFTDHRGAVLEQRAEYASCGAVNRYGTGRALRKAGKSVQVRSLPGYRAQDVIEVQVTHRAWSVLVSELAPPQLDRQIRDAGLLNAGTD